MLMLNKIITGNIGDDSLSIIDLDEKKEVETLYIKDLTGINKRFGPWDMALNCKNQLLIVNSYSESLLIMDLDNKKIIDHIKLGRFPISVHIFMSKIYILNCDSNSLSILDENSLSKLEEVYLGEKPSDVLIDSFNFKIYVANSNGNSISVIDLVDNSIEIINVNFQPFKLFIYGSQLFILSYVNNGVLNYCCICSMDLENRKLRENKIKGLYMDFIIMDDLECILTNSEDGYLFTYNLKNKNLSKKLYLGGLPNKMIIDNKRLYVTDLIDNCIKVVNLVDYSLDGIIKVGKEPQGFILL